MQARRVNAILESMQCSVWPYMRKVKSFSVDGERRTGRGERGGGESGFGESGFHGYQKHHSHSQELMVDNTWRTIRFTTVEAVIEDYCIRLPILPIILYQTNSAVRLRYKLQMDNNKKNDYQISKQIPFLKNKK